MKVPAVNLYKRKSYYNNNRKLSRNITKTQPYVQRKSIDANVELQKAIDDLSKLSDDIKRLGVLACTGQDIGLESLTEVLKRRKEKQIENPVIVAVGTEVPIAEGIRHIDNNSCCVAIVQTEKTNVDIEEKIQEFISKHNENIKIEVIKAEEIKQG